MLKVVYFLRTKKRAPFEVYFFIPRHNLTQSKVSNIPKTFSYYSHTITNLTNIWHCPEQPWKSHTWIFPYYLPYSRFRCLVTWYTEVKLCKVSDGTKVVGKCLRNFLIPFFGSGCVWGWRNIQQTVRKKYTSFRTIRTVALQSVNKIFPESYDFAANKMADILPKQHILWNFFKPASTGTNKSGRFREVVNFVRFPLQRNVWQGLKKIDWYSGRASFLRGRLHYYRYLSSHQFVRLRYHWHNRLFFQAWS
jgi:hypothetical protein